MKPKFSSGKEIWGISEVIAPMYLGFGEGSLNRTSRNLGKVASRVMGGDPLS